MGKWILDVETCECSLRERDREREMTKNRTRGQEGGRQTFINFRRWLIFLIMSAWHCVACESNNLSPVYYGFYCLACNGSTVEECTLPLSWRPCGAMRNKVKVSWFMFLIGTCALYVDSMILRGLAQGRLRHYKMLISFQNSPPWLVLVLSLKSNYSSETTILNIAPFYI